MADRPGRKAVALVENPRPFFGSDFSHHSSGIGRHDGSDGTDSQPRSAQTARPNRITSPSGPNGASRSGDPKSIIIPAAARNAATATASVAIAPIAMAIPSTAE